MYTNIGSIKCTAVPSSESASRLRRALGDPAPRPVAPRKVVELNDQYKAGRMAAQGRGAAMPELSFRAREDFLLGRFLTKNESL